MPPTSMLGIAIAAGEWIGLKLLWFHKEPMFLTSVHEPGRHCIVAPVFACISAPCAPDRLFTRMILYSCRYVERAQAFLHAGVLYSKASLVLYARGPCCLPFRFELLLGVVVVG